MVRLKSRYILFEILYPPTELKDDENNNLIMMNHRPSPVSVSIKAIIQEIRRSLQLNFGDYGSGKINSLLQIKYFSNNTSTGIIRCHREDSDILLLSLFYINKINDTENIIINPVKLSGTIKKIEQYSIRRSTKLLALINKFNKKSSKSIASPQISTFTDDFKDIEMDDNDS